VHRGARFRLWWLPRGTGGSGCVEGSRLNCQVLYALDGISVALLQSHDDFRGSRSPAGMHFVASGCHSSCWAAAVAAPAYSCC
jgi:hypothetical protein